jgi:hypothetical protein
VEEDDPWEFLLKLDEELLIGGVILSEWCTFIVRDHDTAFASGAHLSSILAAVSGIETYLRSEYGGEKKQSLHDLINSSPIKPELKDDLHRLRKYRNRWVHVEAPWADEELLDNPDKYEQELEEMGKFAARALRRTIYENQCS